MKESAQIQLKRNHTYFHQCQLQLYVGRDIFTFCDFVVATGNDIFIEQITLCREWVDTKIQDLELFFDSFVLSRVT